mmetsp:Transcript_22522/g.45622  ORF Transcript_22522/g.45622 Transcript_22522/m.45622 type:complete len:201 (+) Transcript_22522:1944-2546(+)
MGGACGSFLFLPSPISFLSLFSSSHSESTFSSSSLTEFLFPVKAPKNLELFCFPYIMFRSDMALPNPLPPGPRPPNNANPLGPLPPQNEGRLLRGFLTMTLPGKTVSLRFLDSPNSVSSPSPQPPASSSSSSSSTSLSELSSYGPREVLKLTYLRFCCCCELKFKFRDDESIPIPPPILAMPIPPPPPAMTSEAEARRLC